MRLLKTGESSAQPFKSKAGIANKVKKQVVVARNSTDTHSIFEISISSPFYFLYL